MAAIQLKVARIGNSRGVRIPAPTLARFHIGDSVVMEERADGIFLRPIRAAGAKLSWDDTALAMATEAENWSAWDGTVADGLDQVPWELAARRSADRKKRVGVAAPRTRKRPTK